MDELNREVGGLRCRDVLEHLSSYVDGELSPEVVAKVEDHLKGCDRCERFGGTFGHVVTALRRELGTAGAVDEGVAGRLRKRLQAV